MRKTWRGEIESRNSHLMTVTPRLALCRRDPTNDVWMGRWFRISKERTEGGIYCGPGGELEVRAFMYD